MCELSGGEVCKAVIRPQEATAQDSSAVAEHRESMRYLDVNCR